MSSAGRETQGDSLMIIIRGEVEVKKKTLKDKEVWIRNLKEGGFFRRVWFLHRSKEACHGQGLDRM